MIGSRINLRILRDSQMSSSQNVTKSTVFGESLTKTQQPDTRTANPGV
jgi:hypothetical protein